MAQVQVKAHADKQYQQDVKAGKHALVADAPSSAGGADAGMEPHELLLASLGSCTAITLQMYAKRKGWDLQHVTVDLKDEQVQEGDTKTTKITREIKVEGDLQPDQLESLKVVADKCPIHKLISGQTKIETELSPLNKATASA